jgi:hypothetical protein
VSRIIVLEIQKDLSTTAKIISLPTDINDDKNNDTDDIDILII